MKYISIILLILLHVSCFSNQTELEAKNWDKKPLTKKEILFIEELKKSGYEHIEIDSQIIGLYALGMSSYDIYLKTKILTSNVNADSIRNVGFQISKELYDHVLEDSIIFDCQQISVHLTVKNGKKYWSRESFKIYEKHLLANEMKFKVIKKRNGVFERISI
jgi:hypothetical protein